MTSTIKVQNIKHTNDTTAMTIATGGVVTFSQTMAQPTQPRFYVRNLNFPYQTGGYGTGGTVDINIGTCYDSSNGRFTAPVAGTYMLMMMTQYYDGATGSYVTCKFYKNGSNLGLEAYAGYAASNHAQSYLNTMAVLNAGDYINAYTDFGARDIQNNFLGYLIQ